MTPAGRPKVPRTPPAALTARAEDVLTHTGPLWRIASTTGDHVLAWNAFRTFGPLPTMRWDPHRPPPREQPGRGVLYAAPDVATVVAERFQKYREVDPHTGTPYLFGWLCARPLSLLDLTGDWPVRNGAAHALLSAPRATCRRYAQAIRDRWPDLDGLQTRSTMDGRLTFALFEPAADSLPDLPAYARPLTQTDTFARVYAAAELIGYHILAPGSADD